MKFGKLANLKKWHLLWVAGMQMWPNGNGNGNIIAKSWYIGLGYCCQFSVNWHRHSLGWWQKSNWLGRSWCEWRPRKPSAATRWAPTTTNSWAPSGVSLSMNVALYLCLRVFCIFVFLPLHSVHFIHRLPAISLVTQDGWQQPCPDPIPQEFHRSLLILDSKSFHPWTEQEHVIAPDFWWRPSQCLTQCAQLSSWALLSNATTICSGLIYVGGLTQY